MKRLVSTEATRDLALGGIAFAVAAAVQAGAALAYLILLGLLALLIWRDRARWEREKRSP